MILSLNLPPKIKLSFTINNAKRNYLNMSSKKKEIKIEKEDSSERKSPPKWFYLIALLIPLVFFLLLELSLRIFGYGKDLSQWTDIDSKFRMLNNDIAYRYFYTTKSIPTSIQDVFTINKDKNTFRIFVLGGSSAAGYPFTPTGSFSRYLKTLLEINDSTKNYEVINVSLTAVNSYTLRDLIPGILEQSPDCILIYAGHNEYYGALGIGSLESLGQSRNFINLMLYLNKYKTIEFLRDLIIKIGGFFSSNGNVESGTLMSRMAKEQIIKFESDKFFAGIEQFEGNMIDIIKMCKEKNVPLFLSSVASNLKDQPPFTDGSNNNFPSADEVYREAYKALNENNLIKADSLFRLAKDLDGLRFRAPELINRKIKELCTKYSIHYVDSEKELSNIAANNIIGNELMVDHLHPTLNGYKIIGKVFFNGLSESNIIHTNYERQISDSLAESRFLFSPLDSIIAGFRIIILKNDWPFSERKSTEELLKLFNLKTKLDTLALYVIDNKYSWEFAHREAANYYLITGEFEKFLYEMNVLIAQYPFIASYYSAAAEELLRKRDYVTAYKYLKKGYNIKPDGFTTKWLGTINLNNENISEAIKYLNESLMFISGDAQLYYNLAGAYAKNNEFAKALNMIEKCLSINPHFPNAADLKNQLNAVLRN